ncbi:MAG: PIG-L family deacetylase [Lacunisphaera sp.]
MKEFVRRILRSLVTVALRNHSQPYVTAAGARCVVISPHQDDEAFGCAGLISVQRGAGNSVAVVYLTDGAGSHPGHPRLNPPDIAQIRHDEAITAMQRLDVAPSSLHFIDVPDGTLSHLSPPAADNLVRRVAELLGTLQPTELFVPCAEDTSSEHAAAFDLVQRALQVATQQPRVLEYPVWARWRPQQLQRLGRKSRHVWRLAFPQATALKSAVIDSYVSQTNPTPPWENPVLPRGFADCFKSGEEFFFER